MARGWRLSAVRRYLSFRAVNRSDAPGHDPGLQRHHLLPRQLLGRAAFQHMFESIGGQRYRFEDFRENGLLLPCDEPAALRMGLPLHRGPHRHYSQLVMERVGQIESAWARLSTRDPHAAQVQAHMRLELLQRALRRYLLDGQRRRLKLNSRDPLGAGVDFVALDAMVEALWGATRPAEAAARPAEAAATVEALQPMPARARSSSFAA
ncbi:AHH domain-containing protein [Novosphingobium resinovorum]|uniref:AHH domain-containing protein n=1 Tax=Novosphingobium resinovorum TaxID=158500 RepID=UPI002ED37601|nr:AHH domain-containing protein [Novosphingobium resinovorum]